MGEPKSTRLVLQCYPGVATAIARYAKKQGLSITDAKNHVVNALGFIDACEQRGDKLFYIPDSEQQQRLHHYWLGENRQLLSTPFRLADFANAIPETPMPTQFHLIERARASLDAYRRTHQVSAEIALARGTVALVLMSLGDLSIDKGSTLRQLTIEWGDKS